MRAPPALCLALCLGVLTARAGMRLPLLGEGQGAEAVAAAFVAEADALSHEAPLVGTLEVETPAALTAELPDLRDRLRGFAVVEAFPAGRTEADGRARAAWRLRLTPGPEGPWRLMPFVITLRDARTGATRQALTHAILFPEPPPLPEAEGSPECDPAPQWIAPGWRTFGLWALWALLAAAALAALWPLLRRARRALRERTLSPEERARLELGRLLAEGLLAQGRVKRFYYGLTGVVRRYFERAHALRATRQTTQEFLAGLAAEPSVGQDSRDALAAFLAAADRVKFADVAGSAAEAEAAAGAARALIEADAERLRGLAPDAPAQGGA